MTIDPYEWTVRDPLEETVPDPVPRRRRLSDGQRRALEASALVLIMPGFLVAQWFDDSHQAKNYKTNEHVTVVPVGRTGTLAHVQLRLLGRDATSALRSSTTPAGAARLTLVLRMRPLDAQGAKNADGIVYSVRDRAGHVWSALPLSSDDDTDTKPQAGVETAVTVSASLPERLLSSVVLEARAGGQPPSNGAPRPVLRFAH